MRIPYLKSVALGWKFASVLAIGYTYKQVFSYLNSYTYGPVAAAYLRKYHKLARSDLYEIKDEKREYFYIDTSEYTNQGFKDLDHHQHHAHHGPQPDGDVQDSTWLVELDKFLRGEENSLKEHKFYINNKIEFIDKSFPTVERAHEVFHPKV